MIWLIVLYALVSLVVAGSAALRVGIGPGVYALLTSALAVIAAGGLKGNLFWGESAGQRIGGILFAVILMVLAYWLSSGFSVRLFGHELSGTAWGAIGFVICLLFADRRLTGMAGSG
jgi:hypothetical protein